jgi:MFS family permease
MQPVLGAMGDVLGKTRTMFVCLVIVTIATFAGAFAWNLSMLMASRVVSGISLALVAQIVPVKGRQVAISRLLAGGMLGNRGCESCRWGELMPSSRKRSPAAIFTAPKMSEQSD